MSTTAAEVRVVAGTVRGIREPGVAVFRGIPYAAPPVGPGRFAVPRPAESWDGVRPALTFGPAAPQSGGPDGSSGDWLTVNVWSPDLDAAAKLPVMVWIHGGAYVIGASSRPEFDGARLARDGRVVLVSFNYRLGVEGFAHIAGAPDNRGLLDQVAALEWVRDNITGFGGDPGRLTVFGESAGGGSVAALLAMPRASGLFHRAIAQSVPGPFLTPTVAAEIGQACAAELGSTATTADLADADPELLVAAGEVLTAATAGKVGPWGPAAYRSILFAPVVDGETLPLDPWQALSNGAARDVALIAGHTRDEQRLFTALDGRLGRITDDEAATALDLFAPGPDGARRYRDAYPDADAERLYEIVQSDWLFRMPSVHLADAHVAGGGRAHVYELTWPAPGLGACHGLDVPLVFGNLTGNQPALLLGDEGDEPAAAAVSEQMRTAWTAFATHGDPGWPAYTAADRLTRIFDVPGTVTAYPESSSHSIYVRIGRTSTHPSSTGTMRPIQTAWSRSDASTMK
ncbi:carboxylesterase family protein [Actinoplanes sp. TRM 88003]|uniref:Carboxylic ester hydrolase n=1 Tax=Paractinoplanes aksuensis TaxID=2939490 RepID=A0ABT1E3J1_9ACTN|nr:carboxylesterase family protein [Actinoplanes aksuensis]MCO8276685.1 carboxylesterase family protein [Actinoplanes aksuensis]